MNEQDIERRHAEILAMREFQTVRDLIVALQPGTTFYRTTAFDSAPQTVKGPYTVNDNGTVEHDGLVTVSFAEELMPMHVGFLQNSLSKGVFTTHEAAQAYLAACNETYAGDEEWREYVREQRTAGHHVSSSH